MTTAGGGPPRGLLRPQASASGRTLTCHRDRFQRARTTVTRVGYTAVRARGATVGEW